MKARLKIVYNSIKEVDTRSYEKYEEDFRRSTNIDREIIITELITAAYLDCINTREMSLQEKFNVYILVLSLGKDKTDLPISRSEMIIFTEIIEKYIKDIEAGIVMDYKFDF